MNAIKLLKEQHREVEALFETYEGAEDDDIKQQTFEEIADMLAAHSSIEERHVYPLSMDVDEELTRESLEEHLAVKRLIADLLDLDVSDDEFDAKVKVLKEQVEHHVKEEEQQLFPKLSRKLGESKLEELGEDLENALAELLAEGSPRERIPSETEQAPHIG